MIARIRAKDVRRCNKAKHASFFRKGVRLGRNAPLPNVCSQMSGANPNQENLENLSRVNPRNLHLSSSAVNLHLFWMKSQS